jgi:hypothetical protein
LSRTDGAAAVIAICSIVIAGHSRPKDGVASLAYDPAIHRLRKRLITGSRRHSASKTRVNALIYGGAR